MSATAEDWEVLGLEPGADLPAVRRAYHARRALYEPSALATYNLLEEDERRQMLARIDAAFGRITGGGAQPAPDTAPMPAAPATEPEIPIGPPPDPRSDPGACLRFHRLSSGLSLHRIAAETKIGVAILERIEDEAFDELPAAVFVRGHVVQFARELRIAQAEELAKAFVAKMQADVERSNVER